MFKKIDTQGITFLEVLDGSDEWYFGTDYFHGDLYEAEEIFKMGQDDKNYAQWSKVAFNLKMSTL